MFLLAGWGNGFFRRNAATIPKIAQDAGKPYQWLALTLEGERQINLAWEARGNGWASSVTPEGWKGFHEHLVEARRNLTKAWELRPDLPLAANRMMTVALGMSDITEMRKWFDRAVAAQVDYPGVWKSMRWGLRPRWHGSRDAMLAFGVMAANTRRYDTDVPRNLFDSIYDLESDMELPMGEHIYGRADVWPHLREMYEGYIARAEASRVQGWLAHLVFGRRIPRREIRRGPDAVGSPRVAAVAQESRELGPGPVADAAGSGRAHQPGGPAD